MERRTLGRTGEDVTILGYGSMELRGAPRGRPIRDEVAERLLHAVLDNGVNLIDTSIDYGRAEGLIGRFIAHRRDEYFLASKFGCPVGGPEGGTLGPIPHHYDEKNIRGGVEQSLRRLRTDSLDLLQVHISPSRSQMESDRTIETMAALRDEGKARFIGMSGTLPHLREHIAMGVFDVFQIPYSALQNEHAELITAASQAGAGTLIRGGAARGAQADDKEAQVGPIGQPEGEGRRRWEASGVDELLDGMPRHEFVLRYTLSHPALSSAIVGTSSVGHFLANVAIAAKGPLPDDLYGEAKRRFDSVTPSPGGDAGSAYIASSSVHR